MMRPYRAVALGLLLSAGFGCGGPPARPLVRKEAYPLAVQVDSVTAARNAALQPGMLASVQALAVERWTGPGGRPFEVARRSDVPEAGHSRQFGHVTIPIALRTRSADVSQYPCTTCHAGRTLLLEARRVPDAHQNIQPLHPDQKGTVCSSCHAAEDVARLVLANGDRTSLDEGYRLCAQCHFQQAKAWAGGGHGKRLDGWQGRRVVMACADCHDPHKPATQARIPFRAPQLERGRGYGP